MSLKRLLAAFFAMFGFALSACAAPVEVAVVETPPADAISGPALWQLSDEDTTIYLFGTVHVLPDGVEWYDARIARAFDAADVLVTEVDVSDQAAMADYIAGAAALAGGQTMRSLMSDENRTQYDAAMTALGLPPAALDGYEPWFAALNLSVLPLLQAGYNPTSGVEMALAERATGKERTELETIEQQIGLFDGMALEYQLTYLDATVESVGDVVPLVNEMVAEWLEGDAVRLAEIMNGEMDDDYLYSRLLIDRNANWVQWIEQRMAQPGTVFVAVGAGHLAGQGSVQDQLQQRGHTVTRIWK